MLLRSVVFIPTVKLTLDVKYSAGYPDTLPELSLETVDGELEENEVDQLLTEMRTVVRTQSRILAYF